MTREDLLLSRLERYVASDAAPMHMPGHKRRMDRAEIAAFPNPFAIDITEIDGFDNLHHPEGILKDSMAWAASVYGSDRTWYLVNGSTAGVLGAIHAAADGKILMARNSHKSAYYAVILNRRPVCYVYPQTIDKWGINGGISAEDVEQILAGDTKISAVFLTSPTYEGVVSDVRAIAEAAHRHGVPLIVDEAHGAHLSFRPGIRMELSPTGPAGGAFPESALSCGADVVIQSLHKTLPSLTQTAVLHLKGERIDERRLERYLQMFQSSSPSYVFMASIERCIYGMWKHGVRELEAFAGRLERIRERLEPLQNLRLAGREWVGKRAVFAVDPSRIVVSCRACFPAADGDQAVTGERLGQWLREEYHIEVEMCGADYVVAITTFMDRQEHLDRLADAFLEIDRRLVRASADDACEMAFPVAEPVWEMADALSENGETVQLEACLGRVCAEFVYIYPPGIPILAPGERVTPAAFAVLKHYRKIGLPLKGMADPAGRFIRVI